MRDSLFNFEGKLQLYPGTSGWHFVALPQELSEQLSRRFHGLKRGWGSLRVEVSIIGSVWKTSIFPDSKTGTYLLPIKLKIRKTEGLSDGTKARVKLLILI